MKDNRTFYKKCEKENQIRNNIFEKLRKNEKSIKYCFSRKIKDIFNVFNKKQLS